VLTSGAGFLILGAAVAIARRTTGSLSVGLGIGIPLVIAWVALVAALFAPLARNYEGLPVLVAVAGFVVGVRGLEAHLSRARSRARQRAARPARIIIERRVDDLVQ
jgi:uncharacterized SAM-binding protein YcdF (DUF218 family)